MEATTIEDCLQLSKLPVSCANGSRGWVWVSVHRIIFILVAQVCLNATPPCSRVYSLLHIIRNNGVAFQLRDRVSGVFRWQIFIRLKPGQSRAFLENSMERSRKKYRNNPQLWQIWSSTIICVFNYGSH